MIVSSGYLILAIIATIVFSSRIPYLNQKYGPNLTEIIIGIYVIIVSGIPMLIDI